MQTIKLEADTVGQVVYKNEPETGTVTIIKTAENDGEPLRASPLKSAAATAQNSGA